MAVKTVVTERWAVELEGDAANPAFGVNSVDGDPKIVKIHIGTVERIVSVEDWVSLAAAVGGKVKHTSTR